MPIGDAAWLAQTQEATLEPDLPICDPHHHLWTHRPEPLAYQEYLLPEISADINSGHNVRSTVFIEVRAEYRTDGPEEMRPVGEVEFVQKIADESATGTHGPGRAAAAIIGKADLKLGEGVRPVLEAMQLASPNRFRGIRHSVGWDPSPDLLDREIQGALGTDGYRVGARVMAEMGFVLENSLYFPQLHELADFANAVPDLTIVLNHIGGFYRVGPYGNLDEEVMPEWQRGIASAAQCPH
ncbi:MAG: amidohydrolase family protein, partial [Dehalococcoidia bacterium]|nr:amidohydrolase family protein [Dehalococcoidia bacterium]